MSGGANLRKRKYCWNNAVKQKTVEAGISGLFMTCDNHEKQAIAEAYNIIDSLMEDTQEVTAQFGEHSDQDDGEDVADSLKRVCAEVREKGGKIRRCRQRPTGVKNCLFITVQGADVLALAERMVAHAQSSRQCRYLQHVLSMLKGNRANALLCAGGKLGFQVGHGESTPKLITRVLPVEETADVNLKKLNDMIIKCVDKHLKTRDDGTVPSYAMEFKARNNDSIKKSDVLEMLGDAVNTIAPTAKVDLTGADVTFMIQLVRKTMMISGIPNYYSKRKYNMHPKEEKPDDTIVVVGRKSDSVNNVEEPKKGVTEDREDASSNTPEAVSIKND